MGSTIAGATVGLGVDPHWAEGSSRLTTQDPDEDDSAQLDRAPCSSAPPTSQNVTASLLRMASVRAFCMPDWIDSAALRTRVLRSHSLIEGNAAPSVNASTASVTAIDHAQAPSGPFAMASAFAAAHEPARLARRGPLYRVVALAAVGGQRVGVADGPPLLPVAVSV